MIEIYLLEQLVAFETYGTLSAAAEYLHISQPALSHSMQKLEELMGVPLFHRQKNRLALNENGRLTAEYARKILEQERDMVERVRLFDKSRRTITLGSCAPVPVSDIVPLLSGQYRGMTISSEIVNSDEELMEGLMKGSYQIVVLHHDPKKDGLYAVPFRRERLYLSVPEQHPLAEKDEIVLSDIDGQNILLFTQIGFWYEFCKEKLPHVHFLMMSLMRFPKWRKQDRFRPLRRMYYCGRMGCRKGKRLFRSLIPRWTSPTIWSARRRIRNCSSLCSGGCIRSNRKVPLFP